MYDGPMKQFFFVVTALAAVAIGLAGQTAQQMIFVLPMPGGLDQFLAVHLAESEAFRVVTDPTKATVILTDRIGENLEEQLKIMAAPASTAAAKEAATEDTFTRPRMQPLTHTRGTLFLVDRASHQVLWSTFQEPKTSEPKALNRAAREIVERMIAARPVK